MKYNIVDWDLKLSLILKHIFGIGEQQAIRRLQHNCLIDINL
jgi:hypothetical protein